MKNRFDWKVVKDHINTKEENAEGVGSMHCDKVDEVEFTQKFKLYDDDDNLYFEVVATEAPDDSPEDDFIPLDWAMGNYGCTYCEWYDNTQKTWRAL
jgi:hypothetical protein